MEEKKLEIQQRNAQKVDDEERDRRAMAAKEREFEAKRVVELAKTNKRIAEEARARDLERAKKVAEQAVKSAAALKQIEIKAEQNRLKVRRRCGIDDASARVEGRYVPNLLKIPREES